MGEAQGKKLKTLYVMKYLLEQSDEGHGVTTQQIIEELLRYGIVAERKSIYSDIENLRVFGLDIIGEKSGTTYTYYVASRTFELPEVKLLIDAVQSSRFITEKKSRELIRKIETLTSVPEARKLSRQVYVTGRAKNMNESAYYTVDAIHNAIAENRKVTFHYFQWNEKKQMDLRHDGKLYCVSPFILLWNSDRYYLVAYDTESAKIKHYRVDKMLDLSVCEEMRDGVEVFRNLDMAAYEKQNFSMYGGETTRVKLRCRNSLAGVIIDRFGRECMMIPDGPEFFTVTIDAAISDQFFGWIFGLGDEITVVEPQSVRETLRDKAEVFAMRYRNCEGANR